jgi:signal transduction histidine kinase
MSTVLSPTGNISRFELLLEISREITAVLNLPKLLDMIVHASAVLIGCEAASILLIDKASGELRFEAATDTTGQGISSIPVPREGSIAGWVTTNGQPLLLNDVRDDARFYQRVDDLTSFSTRSMLAVPMVVKGKVIGCLEAINKIDETGFTSDDINTLTGLAAQAAVAVENARLFQQSDQISEMVHELRTPLTAIVACSELLQRPNLRPEQAEDLVATIRSEAMRLSNMANNFLDLARLESGRVQLARDHVNLFGVIREIILLQTPQARTRGIEIVFDPPPGVPHVIGDRDRIKQILLNLVSNAIKYNRENGRITIRLSAGDEFVQIAVQDTGPGIPEDALPHIFNKFYRVRSTEGYTEGTGLGLSIVKQLVESHRGKIEIETAAGVGTTFIVSLPSAGPD